MTAWHACGSSSHRPLGALVIGLVMASISACGPPDAPTAARETESQVTAPTAEQPSANPGINERYLDPSMDAVRAAQGFEDEDREVYTRRFDVMDALDLQPGMAVADIGAGSGFYGELMAEAVGPDGRVYLVEIAPQWIEYLNQKFAAPQLEHVVIVQGGERSIMLPEASIDVAFASDTYHHFEYPEETLASIYRALRPGGRWVVLDYDEIPGVTPPSRMEHLRLGKAEAIEEILAAGFQLERDVDIGLRENYLAIFSRP